MSEKGMVCIGDDSNNRQVRVVRRDLFCKGLSDLAIRW